MMTPASRTYFDYNASAPLLECARRAVYEVLARPGNASSIHFEGRQARKSIEQARVQLAQLIGADTSQIIFTSGASEAANQILSPNFRVGGNHIRISAFYHSTIEHPCVLAGGRFVADMCHSIPVKQNGVVDVEALETMLTSRDPEAGAVMVAVMLANNETGVVQPVAEISEIVHRHDCYLFVDAAQALGKIPVSLPDSGADFMIFSSHKIGGPQGCGALVMAGESITPMPLVRGGGQEKNLRAGTENTAAIAGFGAACAWHQENLTKIVKLSTLRDWIEEGIATISREAGNSVAQPVFFGKSEIRLPNTSCFAVPGIRAETALIALDMDGISVSTGSACSSGKVARSHVLEAMNVDTGNIDDAIRLSFGWEENDNGAKRFLDAWEKLVGRMA